MSSRAVSPNSSLSPRCQCHWNEVPLHEWPNEEIWDALGEMSTLPAAVPQVSRPAAPVVTCPSGLEPILWLAKAKSWAGKPSCSASPAEGERDGACLHSKVHSSHGEYFNYLKWVVYWSYNWGLVFQCYCNVSADLWQQSAQWPRSLQLFKTIEKQHPMEAISFLF